MIHNTSVNFYRKVNSYKNTLKSFHHLYKYITFVAQFLKSHIMDI